MRSRYEGLIPEAPPAARSRRVRDIDRAVPVGVERGAAEDRLSAEEPFEGAERIGIVEAASPLQSPRRKRPAVPPVGGSSSVETPAPTGSKRAPNSVGSLLRRDTPANTVEGSASTATGSATIFHPSSEA
jgi:hypothetical protein